MTKRRPEVAIVAELLASPRLTSALTVTGIGASLLAFAAPRLIGLPGYTAAIAVLLVLMAASLVLRRGEIELRGLLPISLLAYLGWALASLIWSEYQWATLGRLIVLGAFTAIGLFIALSRDTIQIARAFGDVLRLALIVSLVLEVFSGILIDTPIKFLTINGHLDELGPISGIMGTRNHLGLVAIIATVTFVIEWRTRSITRGSAVLSIALSGLAILLTRSPVVYLAAFVLALAVAVLWAVRHVEPRRRQWLQFIALALAAVAAGAAWFVRDVVLRFVNAEGELDYRLDLWRQVTALIRMNNLEGFGWIGSWPEDLYPYFTVETIAERQAGSALNAFFDVWLQLGLVGAVLFTGMLGLAFSRSWLLAGRRRSVIFAWPAGVLVALIIMSIAESSVLVDFGWVTFVICCVKASQELSWRNALTSPLSSELPPER